MKENNTTPFIMIGHAVN